MISPSEALAWSQPERHLGHLDLRWSTIEKVTVAINAPRHPKDRSLPIFLDDIAAMTERELIDLMPRGLYARLHRALRRFGFRFKGEPPPAPEWQRCMAKRLFGTFMEVRCEMAHHADPFHRSVSHDRSWREGRRANRDRLAMESEASEVR